MSSVVELGVLSHCLMVQVLAAHIRGPGWVLHSVCVAVGKSFSQANCGNLMCTAPREGYGLRTWQERNAPDTLRSEHMSAFSFLVRVLWKSPWGAKKKSVS